MCSANSIIHAYLVYRCNACSTSLSHLQIIVFNKLVAIFCITVVNKYRYIKVAKRKTSTLNSFTGEIRCNNIEREQIPRQQSVTQT